ncbi:unnamed protein product [Allacma fusca]|uniref:Uncharacterized protein n=1 Tax=Allacma fusca TaxID=39272 RepID=A0A8J2NS32_9HEXA|nr:unnamed protein product [Allacma fusca]
MLNRSIWLFLLAVLAPLAILKYLAMTDSEQQKIKWAAQIHRTLEKPSCRPKKLPMDCNMDICFNYSKCPLSSNFLFYLYPAMNDSKSDIANNSVKLVNNSHTISVELIHRILARNVHRVLDPAKACVFITIVESCGDDNYPSRLPPTYLKNLNISLLEIPNHVIWNHCPGREKESIPLKNAQKSAPQLVKAILVSENFEQKHFRRGFDIVVSSMRAINTSKTTRENSPPLFPIRREYLATYVGTTTSPTVEDTLLELQNQEPFLYKFEFLVCNNASGISTEIKNNNCGYPHGQ